jgi:NTE family protein
MFNNFPADVMRATWGVGRVIGVDVSFETSRRIELQALPGPWEHLRDLLRPHQQRRYGLPSLTHYLMNVTSLYSTARQDASRDLTDLYIRPALAKVGMLQWDSYAKTVRQGYEQALQVVDDEAAQWLHGAHAGSPPSG